MQTLAAIPSVPSASSSSSWLITPNVGLMVWTFVVFGISLYILIKAVFPRIRQALDERAASIDESIDSAERTRREAEELLADYRERLKEARTQADGIEARAHEAATSFEHEAREQAKQILADAANKAERDIDAATKRALDDIRREVADLTVLATEKVVRKTLDEADQRRLVEEALSEIDLSSLSSPSRAQAGASPN